MCIDLDNERIFFRKDMVALKRAVGGPEKDRWWFFKPCLLTDLVGYIVRIGSLVGDSRACMLDPHRTIPVLVVVPCTQLER